MAATTMPMMPPLDMELLLDSLCVGIMEIMDVVVASSVLVTIGCDSVVLEVVKGEVKVVRVLIVRVRVN